MKVKVLQFFTLMLVALSMGMALCHLLEMPVRLGYEPELWSRVTNVEVIYRLFGSPLGAALEGGAWVTAVAWAVLARKRSRAVFRLALAGAACMVLAQVAWWTFVFPVNQEMAGWAPGALPADFAELRSQWEYTHAARAVLQIASLGLIVASVLADPPKRDAL
jgi:cytochrome bd-type quinol oxidase subunit 2